MPTELVRHVVNGPTMGTRFAAVFHAGPGIDPQAVGTALAAAVTLVDRQMSTWNAQSDLMRFNGAPVGTWVDLPADLLKVMDAGLEIGRAAGGAFDIGVLDHVRAWGFQSHDGAPMAAEIARLADGPRVRAYEAIAIDRATGRARKTLPCAVDLSGIAKGFGVDRLAEVLIGFGVEHFLVSIDGELRAAGGKPDGSPWRIAVEQPDPAKREATGVVELIDGAIATSGNYRHRRAFEGHSYSHTIDPRSGLPIGDDTHSATVRAPTCMEADAWATVVMVLGAEAAGPLLAARGYSAMTIEAELPTA